MYFHWLRNKPGLLIEHLLCAGPTLCLALSWRLGGDSG